MAHNHGDNPNSWKIIITLIVVAVISVAWMQSWVRWQQVQNLLEILNLSDKPITGPNDLQRIDRNIEAIKQIDKGAAPFGGKTYEDLREKTQNTYNAGEQNTR